MVIRDSQNMSLRKKMSKDRSKNFYALNMCMGVDNVNIAVNEEASHGWKLHSVVFFGMGAAADSILGPQGRQPQPLFLVITENPNPPETGLN